MLKIVGSGTVDIVFLLLADINKFQDSNVITREVCRNPAVLHFQLTVEIHGKITYQVNSRQSNFNLVETRFEKIHDCEPGFLMTP